MILCDGIQDPGNLGAMIRTSAAFDVDAVILTGESVDAYNPKVVRASSGSILDIPVYSCGEDEVDTCKGNGYYLLASSAIKRDRRKVSEIKELPARSIIVFGSEGKGISPGICAKVDEYFHIPVSARVESLNVTTAAAISLHAFSRLKK
jgi:TrmH family RNA methyltransferase